MIFKKSYKCCLCPNKTQKKLFSQFAGACRWVYNRGLAQRDSCWKEGKKSTSLFEKKFTKNLFFIGCMFMSISLFAKEEQSKHSVPTHKSRIEKFLKHVMIENGAIYTLV